MAKKKEHDFDALIAKTEKNIERLNQRHADIEAKLKIEAAHLEELKKEKLAGFGQKLIKALQENNLTVNDETLQRLLNAVSHAQAPEKVTDEVSSSINEETATEEHDELDHNEQIDDTDAADKLNEQEGNSVAEESDDTSDETENRSKSLFTNSGRGVF